MTPRRAYEPNYALLDIPVEFHAGALPLSHSFLSVDGNNIVLTAMKTAQPGPAPFRVARQDLSYSHYAARVFLGELGR